MSGLDLHVELDGPDLLAELTAIGDAVPQELRHVSADIGEAIEKASKGPTPERSGDLQRSIFWEWDDPPGIIVGPHLFYGEFVHKRVPFMLMAYQIAEPTIDRLIDQAGDAMVNS